MDNILDSKKYIKKTIQEGKYKILLKGGYENISLKSLDLTKGFDLYHFVLKKHYCLVGLINRKLVSDLENHGVRKFLFFSKKCGDDEKKDDKEKNEESNKEMDARERIDWMYEHQFVLIFESPIALIFEIPQDKDPSFVDGLGLVKRKPYFFKNELDSWRLVGVREVIDDD